LGLAQNFVLPDYWPSHPPGGICRAKILALNLGQVRQPTGAPVDKKEGVSQCSVELLVAPLAT